MPLVEIIRGGVTVTKIIHLRVSWLSSGSLRFWAFTAVARVQSRVRELSSHKPRDVAKKKKEREEDYSLVHLYIHQSFFS